jgi:hypothetical protein
VHNRVEAPPALSDGERTSASTVPPARFSEAVFRTRTKRLLQIKPDFMFHFSETFVTLSRG